MGQSPSCEADSQEILRLLWNLKVEYFIHKSPQLVPIFNHTNPTHTFPPYFPNIQSNISFPSMLTSSEWLLSFRFSEQNYVYISHLSRTCDMLRPSHPPYL